MDGFNSVASCADGVEVQTSVDAEQIYSFVITGTLASANNALQFSESAPAFGCAD